MIDRGPDVAQLPVHLGKITIVLQKLLDDEVGEGLGLLTIHIGFKLAFDLLG